MENEDGFPIGCGVVLPGVAPVQMEILLWLYGRAGEWPGNSAFFENTAQRFVAVGVADKDETHPLGYRLTGRGRAWVMAVLQTPPPRIAYFGADGEEIHGWE